MFHVFQESQLQQSGLSNSEEHPNPSARQLILSPAGTVAESPKNSGNEEWHVSFAIPELDVFSTHVLNAINTGVVTGSARREIVQILRTYVLAHTCNLKSEHYNTVCRKLVDKYPKLEDTEGDNRYVGEASKLFQLSMFSHNLGLMEDIPSILI